MVTSAHQKPKSLADWQEMIWGIYKEKDERDYGIWELLVHVHEETARIDEGRRKESYEESVANIPQLFIWFLAFCSMVNVDLEQAFWSKYHGCCPYCGAFKNCNCIAQEEKLAVWRRDEKAVMPDSLDAWQEMIERIYGRMNRFGGLDKVWAHVHEELSEASRALRLSSHPSDSHELQSELADVIAWFLGFCNWLKINLGDVAYQQYPGVCDTCYQPKCACPKV